MLKDDYFGIVRVLVRRGLAFNHPKLQQELVDFNDINDYTNKLGKGDIIFCCIGTTQKKVKGDRAAYEKIDHDIPVNAARIGSTQGYKKFLIVSSVGADPSSTNFYLQLKGKTENAVKQFAFDTISIFRPSMLLGKRKERRPAEKIGQVLMQVFSFMLIGSLNKYHPIKARDVAKAMVAESKQTQPGIHIPEYKEIMKLIR
jgi:uncharacterized protein YbjT (DUF2867 family)